MSKHTEAKLEVRKNIQSYAIKPIDSDYAICYIEHKFRPSETVKANAARIVECWNNYDEVKALNAELVEALEGVINSRDERCHEREQLNTNTEHNLTYWSPSASLIGSEAIAKARAALEKAKAL